MPYCVEIPELALQVGREALDLLGPGSDESPWTALRRALQRQSKSSRKVPLEPKLRLEQLRGDIRVRRLKRNPVHPDDLWREHVLYILQHCINASFGLGRQVVGRTEGITPTQTWPETTVAVAVLNNIYANKSSDALDITAVLRRMRTLVEPGSTTFDVLMATSLALMADELPAASETTTPAT